MGQRHNRRRTRPRSSQNYSIPPVSVKPSPESPLLNFLSIWNPTARQPDFVPIGNSSAACIPRRSSGLVSAPTWHHGYTAWQIRESSLQEFDGTQAEQCRLFGGEPGDDINLCYRMLEFFGGLDYIDPARQSTVGD